MGGGIFAGLTSEITRRAQGTRAEEARLTGVYTLVISFLKESDRRAAETALLVAFETEGAAGRTDTIEGELLRRTGLDTSSI